MFPPHSESIRLIHTDRKGIIMAQATLKEIADFFRLPGESLTKFGTEWKALTDEDKADLKQGIGNGTLTY